MVRMMLMIMMLIPTIGVLEVQAQSVPAALTDWVDWVMEDEQYRQCVLTDGSAGTERGQFWCVWPGPMTLVATDQGAQFSLSWQIQQAGWVPLPGSMEHWPLDVRVNGNSEPVLQRDGTPWLWLEPGTITMSGIYQWNQRPQSIRVPASIGRVNLSVNGEAVIPLQREADQLTLGRSTSRQAEADALDLRVYRLLSDGLPMMLTTRIELDASGQAREVTIGPVLPQGFVPTVLNVQSGWPARIEADGMLRLQVQPDSTVIQIQSRATGLTEQFSTLEHPEPWPEQEIWSYSDAPQLRITGASGPLQIDPAQSGAPSTWHRYPAFVMEPSVALSIDVRSRGQGQEHQNRVSLSRQMWLDFDDDGLTVEDRLSGSMSKGWRFDMAEPYRLESARDQSDNAGLLITSVDGNHRGVEWRKTRIGLTAIGRLETTPSRLPVSGWKQTLDEVNLELHLPSGHHLLAAPGSDVASGSWISKWNLLHLFIAAIIAMLAWRAIGMLGLTTAVVYLLIAYHQDGAPQYSLLIVILLFLLWRALPQGKLKRLINGARWISVATVVLTGLPFIVDQVRMTLYPQLENRLMSAYHNDQYGAGIMQGNIRMKSKMDMVQAPSPMASQESNVDSKMARLNNAPNKALQRYSNSIIIQAGRAAPSWASVGNRRSYSLQWSGPVTEEQTVRLIISPPWMTRLLRLLAIAALALLLFQLVRSKPRSNPSKATVQTALLTGLLLALSMPGAMAQTPSPELLAELKARLTQAPECAPDCLILEQAQVAVQVGTLTLMMRVNAGHSVSMPLPQDPSALSIESVQLDRQPIEMLRGDGGQLHLALPRGVHQLDIRYRVHADRIALTFPERPVRLLLQAPSWAASGLTDDRLLTGTLALSRIASSDQSGQVAATRQEFPPYVRVHRHLTLGLDWEVTTQAVRMAPQQGGFSVRLPLLDGERVLTAGYQAIDGELEAAFADGVSVAEWRSNLPQTEQLQLTAPSLAEHAEIWTVQVGDSWRAEFEGVPESAVTSGGGTKQFTFQPQPGETLSIDISKPVPVSGESQSIESVRLVNQHGQRATQHDLSLSIRASQGGLRRLSLPQDVELISVSRAGQTLGLRLEEGALNLPVQPGVQSYNIRFRSLGDNAFNSRSPEIDLGSRASNLSIQQQLSEDRWVLFTYGPQMGPAVLYWGELLVLILVAVVLARIRFSPLKAYQWMLLGIGFSTFSWGALAVVVVWLFVMGWRQREGSSVSGKFRFDAMQLLLAGVTVIAVMTIVISVPYFGLLGSPDMHIVGNGSSASRLNWTVDQTSGVLPMPGSLSIPMWCYRALMLAWALWLANALVGWLKWAFTAWTAGGYWQRLRPFFPKDEKAAAPDAD